MITIDHINAIFTVGGIMFVIINILQLTKDKQVKGVSIISMLFFGIWSWWLAFFYYKNSHYYSMIAAIFMGVFEIVWISLWMYYRFINKFSRL